MVIVLVCSSAVTDEAKRKHYRQKISDYMDRAEKIKQHVDQEKEGQSLFYLCYADSEIGIISEISEHLEIRLNIQYITAYFHFCRKKTIIQWCSWVRYTEFPPNLQSTKKHSSRILTTCLLSILAS